MIAGSARGRRLKAVPGTGTRPTADRVKEAIFSMIGPYFSGETALDLFAGTGALGIEALSRGAGRAVFVDQDKRCVDIIVDNLRTVGFAERAEVYRNDAQRALKALAKRQRRFDLVFLDPPYRLRLIDTLLGVLEADGLLQPGARVVAEHSTDERTADRIGELAAVRRAVYGDTAVTIYRKEGKEHDRGQDHSGDGGLPGQL